MIEFNRYNYGLGAGTVDVTPLAQAIDAGQLHPQFTQGLSCQAWWAPNGQPLDPQNYVDNATAAQIASLLGASVVQHLPIDLQCTGMPLANFIQFPDGSVINAGALASVAEYPAVTPSADRLQSIISQLTMNSFSDQWNAPEPANPVTPVALPPATIPTPVLPVTPVTLPSNPAAIASITTSYPQTAPIVNSSGTPAASVQPVVNSAGAATSTTTPTPTVPASTTTDWTTWFTQTSVGSIPNWALVAGAAVLLFGFSGGGGRR